MNKISSFTVFFIIMILSSCSRSIEKMLIGKWHIEEVEDFDKKTIYTEDKLEGMFWEFTNDNKVKSNREVDFEYKVEKDTLKFIDPKKINPGKFIIESINESHCKLLEIYDNKSKVRIKMRKEKP